MQTATARLLMPTSVLGVSGPNQAPEGNAKQVGIHASARPGSAETITVEPETVMLVAGDSVQLVATVADRYGNVIDGPTVRWASADEATAKTTDAGLVTAEAPGNASITAKSGRAEGDAVVTVEARPEGEQPPTALIESPALDVTVQLGDPIEFLGSASDADGVVVSHAWDFGDGATASVEDPGTHVYASSGRFTATYQVVDDQGLSSQVATRRITVDSGASGKVVVFEDGFEMGDLSAWDATASKYSVTSDPSRVRSGSFSLQAQTGTVGELNKWFMPGYSDVHVEFDVMFPDGFQNLRSDGEGMHFFGVLGNRTEDKWSASGKAGVRPDGTDFFLTVLEPGHVRADPSLRPLRFYTYYPDMSCAGGCWGDYFMQPDRLDLETNRWYHVEIRLKANTPGENDGAQELWIDGVNKIEATGMRWRDTDEVRVNQISVWNYMPGSPPDQYIWIDNVVVWRPE
jgi:PKD repeat protein